MKVMATKSRVRRTKRVKRKKVPLKQKASARRALQRPEPSKTKARAKTKKTKTSAGVVEAALAAFAHEVRTPLTGILAISDLLATSELGERERRWVDTIKAGAQHLSSLATL